MVAQSNPQIRQAVVKLREMSADEKARDMIERREKGRRDYQARVNGAIKDAKTEIAINLLKMNIPIEQVAAGTGLSLEEVEMLTSL